MAEKRMFTKSIIDSDAFLEMPLSAQALYFHLNMRADDDGFIKNPNRITSYVGASIDDLRILLVKRFVIRFDSGVIVIKHWRMHNTLKSDRYHPTEYQDELALLCVKPNKAYTEKIPEQDDIPELQESSENSSGTKLEPERNQNGTSDLGLGLDLDLGLGLGLEKSLTVSNDTVCWTKDVQRVLDVWNSLGLNKIQKISKDTNRGKMLNARLKEYGADTVVNAIERIKKSSFLKGQNLSGWTIVFDWFIKPNNFIKVMEGNYDDNTGSTQPPLNPNKNQVQTDYGSPEDFYR